MVTSHSVEGKAKEGGQASGTPQTKVPRPKSTGCCFTGLWAVREAYPKEIYRELLSHGRKQTS